MNEYTGCCFLVTFLDGGCFKLSVIYGAFKLSNAYSSLKSIDRPQRLNVSYSSLN